MLFLTSLTLDISHTLQHNVSLTQVPLLSRWRSLLLCTFFSLLLALANSDLLKVSERRLSSLDSLVWSVLRSKCEAIWQLMEAATCDTCRCFSKRRRSSSEFIPHLRVLIFILNRAAMTSLWTELRFDCLISVAGAACLYLSTYSRQFYETLVFAHISWKCSLQLI